MNWVDLAVIGVLLISALVAFMRGFVREVLGIAAWVGAGAVSWWAFPYAQPQMRTWIAEPQIADLATYAAVFVVALIVLNVVASLVGGLVSGSILGGLDRTLGMLFGLARGAAIAMVAYVALGLAVPPDQWPLPLRQARTLPAVYEGAKVVVAWLPETLRPAVRPPPAGPETRAEDLFQPQPAGRAVGGP